MSKWVVESNIGYGWEQVDWVAPFDTEEEANKFLSRNEDGDWDGQVRVYEVEG